MRYVKRRRAVLTYAARDDPTVNDNRIDMENAPLNKPLDQKLRRVITPGVAIVKVCQNLPDLFGSLTFANAEGRNFIPRLNYPGGGNVSENTLSIYLSRYDRFVSHGKGKWWINPNNYSNGTEIFENEKAGA